MSILASRLLEIHEALEGADFPHAFGGAIALAYCTEEPRGTRDLDVNVFVPPSRVKEVFGALPNGVAVTARNIADAEREGQVRLWWEETPIDIFLNVLPLHRAIHKGARQVPFAGRTIPVLGCTGLTIFKALFDRTKDWADIEAMVEAGSIDLVEAIGWIEEIAGPGAAEARRLTRLKTL